MSYCDTCGDSGVLREEKCPQPGCRKANGLFPFDSAKDSAEIAKNLRAVNGQKTLLPGIGSGRGPGNPGVRKPKIFTKEEIEAENIRLGLKSKGATA